MTKKIKTNTLALLLAPMPLLLIFAFSWFALSVPEIVLTYAYVTFVCVTCVIASYAAIKFLLEPH